MTVVCLCWFLRKRQTRMIKKVSIRNYIQQKLLFLLIGAINVFKLWRQIHPFKCPLTLFRVLRLLFIFNPTTENTEVYWNDVQNNLMPELLFLVSGLYRHTSVKLFSMKKTYLLVWRKTRRPAVTDISVHNISLDKYVCQTKNYAPAKITK